MKKSTVGVLIAIISIVGLLCFGMFIDCHPTFMVKNGHSYDMESQYHEERVVANIKNGDYAAAKRHLELKKHFRHIADSLYRIENEARYAEYERINNIKDSLSHN